MNKEVILRWDNIEIRNASKNHPDEDLRVYPFCIIVRCNSTMTDYTLNVSADAFKELVLAVEDAFDRYQRSSDTHDTYLTQ